MRHPKAATVIVTVLVMAALPVAVGLTVLYSGVYDVAASSPPGAFKEWLLSTAMDQSVKRHAEDVQPDIAGADLREGGEHYGQMCAGCHGAPGQEPDEIGKGLNPGAPDLVEAAGDWKPGEIYWIVDHGIEMSGMPSFGKTHSPDNLNAITAFVVKLPTMPLEQYRDLAASRPTSAGALGY